MKIKILHNTTYRVSSAISQAFKAGSVVSAPQKTAETLIERGAAVAVSKPSTKGV